MGGRGSAGGARGSKDGVIIGGKPRVIDSYMREARGWGSSYHKDDILEATTDGHGNVTFSWARADSYRKTAKTNRTVYTQYTLQAGAVNGETFGINWNKVQSVSGQTYGVREAARNAGLSWDSAKRQWRRK